MSIHRKDFNLQEVDEQVNFLREMFNLATQISALSGELDQDKKGSLRDIQATAGGVLSLSSTSSGSTITDSITQRSAGTDGSWDGDDLGIFEAEDIQNILRQMNYKIEFIPWGVRVLAFDGIRANVFPSTLTLP